MGTTRKVPVNAGYNQDRTVLGMDYSDCSNQTFSRIDLEFKYSYGNAISLHGNHWSFSIVAVKVYDE